MATSSTSLRRSNRGVNRAESPGFGRGQGSVGTLRGVTERVCDVLIVGGGTGGTAAALALADSGLRVIMTEETDWIGGQLTAQAVPPDEHPWIESMGCTARYREYRERVRLRYRLARNLRPEAVSNKRLNPGGGWVSHLCHDPALGHEILREMIEPARGRGLLLLLNTKPISATTSNGQVDSVTVRSSETGEDTVIRAKYVLDATETGELLPLTGTEYRLGAESKSETDEPNALDGQAETDNVQGITWCAAIGWDPEGDHTIEKPREYDFWLNHQPKGWPVKLLSFQMLHVQRGELVDVPLFSDNWFSLFTYRQIVDPAVHTVPTEAATIMNWPMNDYYEGTVIDVDEATTAARYESSKQLTLSMLYWMQTEHGYKGLRLRPDLTGTKDGLAKSAYIRESRRIVARHTIREQDVASYTNPGMILPSKVERSVGIGAYRIDLHPSTNGRPTIDTSTLPFQIPLGSLIPVRMRNLLPACKNLGVTHITNGCYRLHPVEWNIGEAAGLLAAFCLKNTLEPAQVDENPEAWSGFEGLLHRHGIDTDWPRFRAL